MKRRDFLEGTLGTTAVAAGATGAAVTAGATRALLANDRIGLAIVGCGARGGYLLGESLAAGGVEIVALADVWRPARERMAARVKEQTGREPRLFARYREALALPEVDAVVIATPDFGHPRILADAVGASKDAFVEKPLSARLEDAVMATDAVKASGRIVQVGTQRRSDARFRLGAERVRAGALGPIASVECAWHRNVASWARPLEGVRAEDVDWEQYLMGLEARPFDPARLRRWQWFSDYTTGLVGLLGSHVIDAAQWYMDDPFPATAVALGGILTWRDGREHSDTFECAYDYAKGWMLHFSSRLGSGPETDYAIFHGRDYSLDTREWTLRPAANNPAADAKPVGLEAPARGPSHVAEWLECVRARRAPSAGIDAGYSHAVACCLAREAERRGRRMRYDTAARRIVEA